MSSEQPAGGSPSEGNLLGDLPDATQTEVTELLAGAGGVRIERIVSHGQASPEDSWYDQPEHEFVTVLSGSAGLLYEDGSEVALSPGGWVWIQARTRHRVAWTDGGGPTVWLAVFLPAAEQD